MPQTYRRRAKNDAWPYRVFLYFFCTLFFLEAVLKITVYDTLFNMGTLYMALFTVPVALLLTILCTFFPYKVNWIIAIVLTTLITLLFGVQIVYEKVFVKQFMVIASLLQGTTQGKESWMQVLEAIGGRIVAVLLIFLPLILLILFGRKVLKFRAFVWPIKAFMAIMFIATQLIATVLAVNTGNGSNEVFTNKELYRQFSSPYEAVNRFGLLTSTRIDLKQLLFGVPDEELPNDFSKPNWSNPSSVDSSSPSSSSGPVEYGYNVMNIDFESLIAGETDKELKQMHEYFYSLTPTKQNEYTGKFQGKNLILLTCEAFSPYVIDPDLTPTLYKMYSEGFQFTNFYTPIWGVSTSDGEYVACTGLIPKSGVWSFSRSSQNWLPFTMGRQTLKLGYEKVLAYHNHTYSYYDRDKSHPNMGYEYKGYKGGLDITYMWPESDDEMIEITVDEYIDHQPFHAYYMTVSGHVNYSWIGNSMSKRNRAAVNEIIDRVDRLARFRDNETVKAYLACQLELEKALTRLISELEAAGIAENTVIALSPDHYPYGLSTEDFNLLAGHEVEQNFELYKGSFLLWHKGMTPTKVDKAASSLDILPTLSNLFGMEFDSRLLMGRDILSTADPLVIFANRSWISDKGQYNSQTKTFTPFVDASQIPEDYVKDMNQIVKYKFTFSAKILERDYYSKVIPKW